MITKVSGDILMTSAQAIAHSVAPHDHFNQGLALSLRERFPAMAKDFRHYCHQDNPKPGAAWLWAGPEMVIINLMAQTPAKDDKSNPGQAEVKHLSHALKSLRDVITSQGIRSLAMPKLATGVGGLEWSEVEPLIEQHLGDLDIPVIIYDAYQKGVKANEPL